MRWWEALAMLLAVALLLVEGFRNLGLGRRKKSEGDDPKDARPEGQQLLLGWLGLLIVFLVCIAGLLSSAGRLVFSPELGFIMAQGGRFTAWLLRVLLLTSSMAAGLAWCVGRSKRDAHDRKYPWWLWLTLVIGLGLGSWAAFQVQILGQDDMGPVHIYAYDLWWPPLLLWYGVCLAGCLLGLLGILEPISQTCRREIPWWVATVLLFALTLLMARYWLPPVIRQGEGSYPAWPLWLFRIGLLLSVPTSIGLTARLLLESSRMPPQGELSHEHVGRHKLAIAARVVPGLLAALGVVLVVVFSFDSQWETPLLDSRLLVLWAVFWLSLLSVLLWLALLSALLAFARSFLALDLFALNLHQGGTTRSDIPGFLRLKWRVAFIILFSLNVLSLTPAAPLLPLPSFSLGLQMAALFFAWSVLLEPDPKKGLREGCMETMETLGGRLGQTLKSMKDKMAPAPQKQSLPESKDTLWSRVTSAAKTLVVIGAIILVFCAVIDVPNARRTIIQPFKVTHLELAAPSGHDASKTQALGTALSDRLLNALNAQLLLSQPSVVLQPRVLHPQKANVPKQLPNTTMSERRQREASTLTPLKQRETSTLPPLTTSATGNPDEFSEELKLELGLIKVPVNLITAQLRPPLRKLLGGRLLQGSLQEERAGYTLLVKSSTGWGTGQSWNIFLERERAPTLEQALPILADRMALKILSEDPAWAGMGLTGSWEAFESYRLGMASWARFHEAQDYSALTQAIQNFWAAVHADPRFALAAYHLGLALQLNGDVDDAAQAFRDSVEANPQFIPGHVAQFLASSLGQPPYSHPVATPPPKAPTADAKQPGATSSLPLYVERLPPLERAQFYHGLCIQTLSSWEKHRMDMPPQEELLAQAFFYCTQAEREYAQVPATLRAEPDTQTSQASVLNQLGTILVLHLIRSEPFKHPEQVEPPKPFEKKSWFCASEDTYGEPIEPTGRPARLTRWSLRLQMASRYYKRAAALTTHPTIRCDAAMLSFQMGKEKWMASLEQDVAAHVNFAELHRADAEDLYWKRRQVTQTLGALFRLNCLLQKPETDVLECRPPDPDAFLEVSRKRIAQALQESRRQTSGVDDPFRLPESNQLKRRKPTEQSAFLEASRQQVVQYIEDTRKQLDSDHARALEKYRAAVKLNPTNLDALAGFARTFWQWNYLSSIVGSTGPDPEWNITASEVRQVLEEEKLQGAPTGNGNGLAKETGNGLSRKRATQVRTALGELHLAMNEPGKASLELEQAALLVDDRPCFKAIYWDWEIALQAEQQAQQTPEATHGSQRKPLQRALTACPELQEGSWKKASECRTGTQVAQRRPTPDAQAP
ncbi:tetratricopeptide repeat protein [Archangium minus]|uniref:Tetratricopeptide repeat protein n=1 Tax=Archangium minus TaxID=83450 RepID=A0ABY9WPX3_9BACT|nr:tetratricopeptide repeat protein [Archangium minus]